MTVITDSNPLTCRKNSAYISKAKLKTDKRTQLYVEGESDANFYRSLNILDETKIYLLFIDSKEAYYFRGNNKKKGKEAVLEFILEQLEKTKTNTSLKPHYGIVDRDYDGFKNSKNINPEVENYIALTDGRDLETTLLQLDFSNIEQKFIEDSNCTTILKQAIENASFIGKLRDLKSKHKKQVTGIKFTSLEEEKAGIVSIDDYKLTLDGYYKFIDEKSMINESDLLQNIVLKNDIPEIKKMVSNCNRTNLSYCRGHDIFDFITIQYYRLGNVNMNYLDDIRIQQNGFKKETEITKLRSCYEKQMEKFFDKKTFVYSNLYQFFVKLNNLN